MMHVRISLITPAPPVLAGCLAYLEGKVRPVVEGQPGSLGLSLLAGQDPGAAIIESFWATHEHELVWAAGGTEALVRGELARNHHRAGVDEAVDRCGLEPGGDPGLAVCPYDSVGVPVGDIRRDAATASTAPAAERRMARSRPLVRGAGGSSSTSG
jgi:hypothetical protein